MKVNDLLPRLQYSPELASSDHFSFPNLKKWFSEKKFGSSVYFKDFDNYYLRDVEKLRKRLEFEGDTVDTSIFQNCSEMSYYFWVVQISDDHSNTSVFLRRSTGAYQVFSEENEIRKTNSKMLGY